MVRQRADWMRPADERILEHMREEGNLTPGAVEALDVTVANYASTRLSTLAQYGLVERVAGVDGLYRLTETGEAFLDGDLDAGTLDAE